MEQTKIQVIMRSSKKGYLAYGIFDGSGLTVLKGSKVCKTVSTSYRGEPSYSRSNKIDNEGRTLEDLYFKSPSAASRFVCGRSANGWVEWVTPNGTKLNTFRGMNLKKVEVTPVPQKQEELKPKSEQYLPHDLKEKTEQMLLELTKEGENTQIVTRSDHTSIYYSRALIANIYYLDQEIRVEMRDAQSTLALYNELLKESLVYQKASADLRSAPGKFQFFVGFDNAEAVFFAILLAAQERQHDDSSKEIPVESKITPKVNESSSIQKIQEQKPTPAIRETPVARTTESNRRIEKKLDYLLGMINTLNVKKEPASEEQVKQEEPKAKGILLEETNGNAPMLMCLGNHIVTGLIFKLRLKSFGLDGSEEKYRLFFIKQTGECISNKSEIHIVTGKEYTVRIELFSGASEEERIYLIIQGINAAENEARQMIAFSVKIAFTGDFGLG